MRRTCGLFILMFQWLFLLGDYVVGFGISRAIILVEVLLGFLELGSP